MFTAFRWLARFKGLRGTALDPFGRTEERRTERALIDQYRGDIEAVLAGLNASNHALALDIARLPEQIKGFGHVKERHLAGARQRRDELLARWRQPVSGREPVAA
jgi:indolepyruvate ferredoxin oxidoreductase